MKRTDNSNDSTKVVVTGGAGFIGSHLAEELAGRSYRVTILDDLSTGKKENVAELVKKQNVEAFSDAIHEFFKVIDEKDLDTEKRIEAKPLDTAIEDVRQKLADAMEQIGVQAPASPEFEPLPEPRPAGAMGSPYGEMYEQ